jgi:DNA-binding response OmpR family regulator
MAAAFPLITTRLPPPGMARIQFDLLIRLAQRPDVVFPRSQLLNEVWGHTYADDVRTVDSMIKRLRQKLRDAGAPSGLIDSRRERGYLLRRDLLTACNTDPPDTDDGTA